MSTGTLDLSQVEEERRRLEDEDPEVVAHRIVEEVLAAEAAHDTAEQDEAADADGSWFEPAPKQRHPRPHLVLLNLDEPLVLVPGPVYDPGPGAFVASPDPLPLLVDRAVTSLRSGPQTVTEALRSAADSPAMPGTRWMLLGLLWMAAFAGLVPFAFATIGNALEVEIDVFGEEEPAVEQQPADVTSTENPSVEGQDG